MTFAKPVFGSVSKSLVILVASLSLGGAQANAETRREYFQRMPVTAMPSVESIGVYRFGVDLGKGVVSTWEIRYLGKGTWAEYATHLNPPLPYVQWQVDCAKKKERWVNYEGGKRVSSWGAWTAADSDPWKIGAASEKFVYACYGPHAFEKFVGYPEYDTKIVRESLTSTAPDRGFSNSPVGASTSSSWRPENPSTKPTLRETLSDTPFRW